MVHGKAYFVMESGAGYELPFITVSDNTLLSPPVLMHGGLLRNFSCLSVWSNFWHAAVDIRLCRVQQRAITPNLRQSRVITSLRSLSVCL